MMADYPSISIITPSFNQGKYLERTILSVLEQGYPNLEYIIIDGGSTDESVDIIKKYADRLAWWVSEPDRGQSHAINKGFERATGEIFGWLNSDDWYHPGALQAVADAFAANPDAGAVVGAGEMVDEEGNQLIFKAPEKVDLDFLCHWLDDFFWQPSCFFTRKVWEAAGPLDEQLHYAMDLALWFNIAKKFRFATVKELLAYNLKHSEAKTTADGIKATIDAVMVIVASGGDINAGRSCLVKEFEERDRLLLHYDAEMKNYARGVKVRDQRLNGMGLQQIELKRQLAESRQRTQELLESLSWKVTAPLRWLADRVVRMSEKSAVREKPLQISPYQVCKKYPLGENRPRIVHALANFMTGGSSRLVVDLIEHLGHRYEQEVITYFCPDPPHYTNFSLYEFRDFLAYEPILAFFREFKPDLVHIHYWGDVDDLWYEQVFTAAEQFGCRIVENVNTPVVPYFSAAISRYVFVSDYVRDTFGLGLDGEMTIHPGSNLQMFERQKSMPVPDDCVGMVYRLEKDKLNEQAIEVFIRIVKLRPKTKALIVGGGAFLDLYRQAVTDNGVEDAFIFTDYVSYESLPSYYEQMSLFVAPVWKESFGQVTPFAMSMGLPVVGYNVGGLAEIIDDPALLASPGDSDMLAEIAVALLDDREKRICIGEDNLKRSRELFSVEAMVLKYDQLYSELLGVAG
jgi:glycosyltransferase involved in cell wall biosynthesis